jgi:dTDP-4-dehydrorhamnose reductase
VSAAARNTAWVTGAGGLIGSHLLALASQHAPAWHARPITREILDLTDFTAVRALFLRERPNLILHCAALSRSPDCQANPKLARLLNVDVTRLLQDLAADVSFVFFSTDLVFDGKSGNYIESSPVNPLSVYAETKVAAEQIVLSNPRHLVIRTSLNCGASPTGDRGFDEQMKNAWLAGQTLRLFEDEFRCPIPAEATARATWQLAQNQCTGLFHVAGAERLSRWQIGELLASHWPDIDCRRERTSLRNYQGAPRSPDTSLNCTKARETLSFPRPSFSAWLGA